MDKPILVIGATGKVGGPLTRRLLEHGTPVRGVTRHAARVPSDVRRDERFELVEADLAKPGRVEAVVEGVEAVYLTLPETEPDPTRTELGIAKRVIDASETENVDQVVLHTWLRTQEGPLGVRLIDVKKEIEWRLLVDGVPYTILRPGLFLETLMDPSAQPEPAVFTSPLPPTRRVAAVAADDVAQAAAMFLWKGPQMSAFDLHLPGGVSGPEVAEARSRLEGRTVAYRAFEAPAVDFVRRLDLAPDERGLYAELFEYLRAHDYLGQPDRVFQALPAFRYTDLPEYLRASAGALVPRAPAPGPSRR